MKKKFFLITAILTMGLAVGTFIASCSSDSDEPTYENNAQRIEAMKTKVLKLAEMYGLKIGFNQEFEEQCKQDNVYLDSIELYFSSLSRLKGLYTMVHSSGNQIIFNSEKERFLKIKRSTATTREYGNYGGCYNDSYIGSNFIEISYLVTWWYDEFSQKGSVSISDVSASDSKYSVKKSNFSYQFIGLVPNFIYSFDITLSSNNNPDVTFTIQGSYKSNADPVSPDAIKRNEQSKRTIIGYSDVIIK